MVDRTNESFRRILKIHSPRGSISSTLEFYLNQTSHNAWRPEMCREGRLAERRPACRTKQEAMIELIDMVFNEGINVGHANQAYIQERKRS